MKYIYTAAWAIIGGITIGEESPLIELTGSQCPRFILTKDPDPYLAKVDEASAVGRLMLKGLVGQHESTDFQSALTLEVEEIKAERKKKVGSRTVLLFQVQGEIEASVKDPFREHETFIVTFDAIERNQVRQLHKAEIEAIKVAIALENDTPLRFTCLADGTYLLDDSGKPVYSISLSVSGEGTVSTPLSEEAVARIGARYAALKQKRALDSVNRLFSQMTDYDSDRLKTFLSGWAAFEILIAKSFKSYEQKFFSLSTKAGQPTLQERFLARIKNVMKDKYRLRDKFTAVTAVLFPNIGDDEAEKNYTDFCELKKLRDKIFHGEPFSEKDLPVHKMAALLQKYLVAFLITT